MTSESVRDEVGSSNEGMDTVCVSLCALGAERLVEKGKGKK